jgi:hypothetical protein
VAAGAGADDGAEAVVREGVGCGDGTFVGLGVGVLPVSSGDGAASGCGAAASLDVATTERTTAQVTRPQYTSCGRARPPGWCSSTARPPAPSSTKPTAAQAAGRRPLLASHEYRLLPINGGPGPCGGPRNHSMAPLACSPSPFLPRTGKVAESEGSNASAMLDA